MIFLAAKNQTLFRKWIDAFLLSEYDVSPALFAVFQTFVTKKAAPSDDMDTLAPTDMKGDLDKDRERKILEAETDIVELLQELDFEVTPVPEKAVAAEPTQVEWVRDAPKAKKRVRPSNPRSVSPSNPQNSQSSTIGGSGPSRLFSFFKS